MEIILKDTRGTNYRFYTDNVSGNYYWLYAEDTNTYLLGFVSEHVAVMSYEYRPYIEEVLDRMIKSLDRDYPTLQQYKDNLEEICKRTHFSFHNSPNILVRYR